MKAVVPCKLEERGGGGGVYVVEHPFGDVSLQQFLLLQEVALRMEQAGWQGLVVPGVLLHVLDADALLLVHHEDAVQQVTAVRGELHRECRQHLFVSASNTCSCFHRT